MDTEGIGSYKKSKTYDVQIFALALLMSSYFIYNSLGTVDESALDRLALVTEVSSYIKTSENSDSQNNNTDLNAFVPKFMWLLRDFMLKI